MLKAEEPLNLQIVMDYYGSSNMQDDLTRTTDWSPAFDEAGAEFLHARVGTGGLGHQRAECMRVDAT